MNGCRLMDEDEWMKAVGRGWVGENWSETIGG